jgi:aerobic-type carbon monoxide dehydrogenase small subunit (CoxS/CutS family)
MAPVQQAFTHHYAAQCGFCTSGMMMAAQAYVDRGGSDDHESIQEALGGHVCRCTGYVKIVRAVEAALHGEVHPERVEASFEPEETEVLIPGSPA